MSLLELPEIPTEMKIYKSYDALLPAIQDIYQLLGQTASREIVFDIDDTLIFDDYRITPNQQVVALLLHLQQNNYNIHLVTARTAGSSTRQQTIEELRKVRINLRKDRDTLSFCPPKIRKESDEMPAEEGLLKIADWKFHERKTFQPVALSVGDQWGDLIHLKVMPSELDDKYNSAKTPWHIIFPNDNVTYCGLKLMA